MKQKKAITPVVATALLLVVAVVAVMGFQNWFNTYQAGLNTNVEGQSNSLQNSIEITNIVGNDLYIKSSSNITLSDIKINSRDCKLSPQLTAGMNVVDIGSCISGLNTNSLDVSLIGTDSVKTKTFYTDSTSQKEFVKFLGNSSSGSLSMIQTLNGGFVLTGWADIGSNYNTFMIKTDSSGNEVWNKSFSFNGYNGLGNSIIQTSNGGFAIAGQKYNSTNHNVLLIKTNSSGSEIWNKTFSFNGYNSVGLSIIQTLNGGFAIAGQKYNSTNHNVLLIKTNSSGSEIWNKTFSFSGYNSIGISMIQTSNGEFAIAGQKYNSTNHNVLLIKTNSSGSEIWNKTFSFNGYKSIGRSIIQTNDGGFAITGSKQNITSSNLNTLLIKTDSSGNQIWNKTFSFNGYRSLSNSIIETADNGFAMSGYENSGTTNKVLLIKTDSNGNTCDYNATGQC